MESQFRTVPPPSAGPQLSQLEAEYYQHLYVLFNPQNAPRVKARKLAELFKKSGLSREALKSIYAQAVTSQDRTVSRQEFIVFTKLVALAQAGAEPVLENITQPCGLPQLEGIKGPDLYVLTQEHIQYYSNFFVSVCGQAELLEGNTARNFLAQTGVAKSTLKKCWDLVDSEHKGALTKGEFIVFMLLVSAAQLAEPPLKLPGDLQQFICCFDEGGQRVSINESSLDLSKLSEALKQPREKTLPIEVLLQEDQAELVKVQSLAQRAQRLLLIAKSVEPQLVHLTQSAKQSLMKEKTEEAAVLEQNRQWIAKLQDIAPGKRNAEQQLAAHQAEQARLEAVKQATQHRIQEKQELIREKERELAEQKAATAKKSSVLGQLTEEFEKLTGAPYRHDRRKKLVLEDPLLAFQCKPEHELAGVSLEQLTIEHFN